MLSIWLIIWPIALSSLSLTMIHPLAGLRLGQSPLGEAHPTAGDPRAIGDACQCPPNYLTDQR